ncbi:MAG: hypothetical protein IJE68_02050 [Clostridia bacterium]|nr:hypothetical protein [Clostridia bacterium]
MRSYPTRQDKNSEKIDNFLQDETKDTLPIRLYRREIKSLPRTYHTINIEVVEQYNGTDLWECIITKK